MKFLDHETEFTCRWGFLKGHSVGVICALLHVSARVYIGYMRVSPTIYASSTPAFIEVTKPVNLMTPSEKDEFIEEILKALEGK
jgi:hypothetical protein